MDPQPGENQGTTQAVLCLDPFHVVARATTAVDPVRRGLWNTLRGEGYTEAASDIKGTRWAVLKPREPHRRTRTTIATIAKTNNRLYRAYLLKEQLRAVFAARGEPGRLLLAGWIAWASRCRIPELVKENQDFVDAMTEGNHMTSRVRQGLTIPRLTSSAGRYLPGCSPSRRG